MTTFTTATARPWTRPVTASPVEFRLRLALERHRHQQQTLREHRPSRRRLRLIRFAGFPVPALITRCSCCNAIWPCREVFNVVRTRFGFTRKLDPVIAFLRRHTDLRELTP